LFLSHPNVISFRDITWTFDLTERQPQPCDISTLEFFRLKHHFDSRRDNNSRLNETTETTRRSFCRSFVRTSSSSAVRSSISFFAILFLLVSGSKFFSFRCLRLLSLFSIDRRRFVSLFVSSFFAIVRRVRFIVRRFLRRNLSLALTSLFFVSVVRQFFFRSNLSSSFDLLSFRFVLSSILQFANLPDFRRSSIGIRRRRRLGRLVLSSLRLIDRRFVVPGSVVDRTVVALSFRSDRFFVFVFSNSCSSSLAIRRFVVVFVSFFLSSFLSKFRRRRFRFFVLRSVNLFFSFGSFVDYRFRSSNFSFVSFFFVFVVVVRVLDRYVSTFHATVISFPRFVFSRRVSRREISNFSPYFSSRSFSSRRRRGFRVELRRLISS